MQAIPPSGMNEIGDRTEQLALFIEAVLDYAIFMLDTEGRIASWNAGAKRINQYEASEIIGQHFSILYPQEDVQAKKPECELAIARSEGHFEEEGWRLKKDGSRFWANVIITPIRDKQGHLLGYGKVVRDFSERREHEERLRQSEEKFRLLVEAASDYAIFMMNPEGLITTWNSGAEKIKGYQASEILGKHYSTFFPPEDVISGKPGKILRTAATEGRAEVEGWRVRKDGSRFWVNALVTALRDPSGNLIGFSKITRDVTERLKQQVALLQEIGEKEKAQQALAKSEESLRELSLSLLRTQDEERRRIGREMHDSLGQYLSVLKMNLGTVQLKEKNLSEAGRQELEKASSLLNDCVKEVRTISYLLYPPMLEEMGLQSAISWCLEGFTQRSGIKAQFDSRTKIERISREIELALFRVLQEALTNVHKHSGSDRVDIAVRQNAACTILEIRDYGKGLPDAIIDEAKHDGSSSLGVGLRGMKERMLQLGGTLCVRNLQPGMLLTAEVPHRKSSR